MRCQRPRFTPEQDREIAADYAAGMSCEGITTKWSCCPQTIYTALDRCGAPRRTIHDTSQHKREVLRSARRVLSDEQERDVARRYADDPCLSAMSLANEIGTCESTIRNAIRRQGGSIRKKSRTYALDESFFDDPMKNPGSAYVVGFIMADGNISWRRDGAGKKTCAGLNLYQAKDGGRDHLMAIRELMKCDRPLRCHTNTTGFGRKPTEMYSLSVGSTRLVRALERWGVCERKSWGCQFAGGLEHSRDAWRGAVDGDGFVSYNFNGRVIYPQIGFCGCVELVSQFVAYCRTISDTKAVPVNGRGGCTWHFQLGGWIAVQIIRALYDGCAMSLPRKNRTAQEILRDFAAFPSNRNPRARRGMLEEITAQHAAANDPRVTRVS